MFLTLYFALALCLTLLLAIMIVKIGTLIGNCPDSSRTAKAASLTIATGFSTIGFGGVILIGAGYAGAAPGSLPGMIGALGFASLCLGLGFSNAVATLRAIMVETSNPTPPQPEQQIEAIPA